MLGTLKSWKEDKGFGFITPDEPERSDIFVHISALHAANIHKAPVPGDRFYYEEGAGKNGKKQAIDLALVR